MNEEIDDERAEAWKLLQACPDYYHDAEEGPSKLINMGDVWAWAYAGCIVLTDENVVRVAELYNRYGFPGLLYYQIEADGYTKSEFTDNNRMIQFVTNEERIRKECPDYNKRAYFKAEYKIDGVIPAPEGA